MAGESPAFIFIGVYMFKAIMAGTFGPVTVNKKLRELHERIDTLEALLGGGQKTETVNAGSFDWRTTHDIKALKQWALEVHDLELKGNKKADTFRAEIDAFLAEG